MARIESWFNQDLNEAVKVRYLDGNVFSQDNQGNLVGVNVFENGEPASLGGSVSANVVRSDGTTVAVSGTLSENHASVILPQSAYAVPGVVSIIIKLTDSGVITTLCAVVANVYKSTTDTVVDPGTIIPSVQDLIDDIETAIASIPADYSDLLAAVASEYSNSKTYPVVGSYAWYDGVLKRSIVPITTAESYTAAHWTNAVIGDDLCDLKSAFEDTQDVVIAKDTGLDLGTLSTSGTIHSGTGANLSSTSGTRTGYIDFDYPVLLKFAFDMSVYNVDVFTYSSHSVSAVAGNPTNGSWSNKDRIIVFNPTGTVPCFRIGIKRVDGATITTDLSDPTSDFYKIKNGISILRVTDASLTGTGIPADAKATGDAITKTNNTMTDITGNSPIPVTSARHYIDLSGSTVTMSDGQPVISGTSSSYDVSVVPCSAGDKFTISGIGGDQTRLWGFISSAGTILSVSAASANATEKVITAPASSAFMITHTKDGRTSYTGETVKKAVESLDGLVEFAEITMTAGYIKTNTDPVDLTPYESEVYTFAIVNCQENDYFTINALAAVSAKPYAFVDSDNHILAIATEKDIKNQYIVAPANAAKLIINTRNSRKSYTGAPIKAIVENLYDRIGSLSNEAASVSLLCYGSSFSYSTLGYVPAILEELCPGINVRLGICYDSGQNLAGHITRFNEGTDYTVYSEYKTENGYWINSANAYSSQDALDMCDWDYIILQQQCTKYTDATYPELEQFADLITGYIDYPVSFLFNMTETLGENSTSFPDRYPSTNKSDYMFNEMATFAENALGDCIIEDVLPCGTAVQNGRTDSTLNALGDNGYMTHDNTGHLQNGLPVLLAGYAASYKILQLISKKRKLFGCPLEPTDAWLSDYNLYTKTAHGECKGVTDANRLLAQKCALMAIKKPFEITDFGS